MMMKCFVMWEPWASLVFEGAKPWEFRKRDYRDFSGVKEGERVAIAAGVRPIKRREIEDLLARLDDDINSTGLIAEKCSLLSRIRAASYVGPLGFSYGCIIGTVTMGQSRLSEDIMPKWRGKVAFDSDRLEHCKWAWPMIEPRRLAVPVPVRGFQGFFNVSINEAAV